MATAANVRVGVTGSVHFAATGTTLPTDATTALDVAFTDLGYITDDGVVQAIDRSTTDMKAWGGDVVRTVQTEHNVTYTFSMMETNDDVLQLFYADADASTTTTEITGAQAQRGSWAVEVVDGSEKIRLVIPDGEITGVGDVTYATEEAIVYELTVTAYPDGSSVKAYKYGATV